MTTIQDQLPTVAGLKHGDLSTAGWGPRLRRRFGYYTPDEWYESAIYALVGPHTRWLDVGCGRHVFPSNPGAAAVLAERCHSLTGLDPSGNIDDNPYLDHRAKTTLEAFGAPHLFDLVTLRMVVEHITAPEDAAQALGRLCEHGGHVVIYTVSKWSLVSLFAAITPLSVHHAIKRRLWNSEERDTFPTAYRMNTRRRLRSLMTAAGFEEAGFHYLPDTRTTHPFRLLNTLELLLWRALRSVGVNYPEVCLLGIYRRR